MAGWVIDQCVEGSNLGGYVTAGFSNTVDYVATPETFYEDPFRKLSEAYASTLLYWLTVVHQHMIRLSSML